MCNENACIKCNYCCLRISCLIFISPTIEKLWSLPLLEVKWIISTLDNVNMYIIIYWIFELWGISLCEFQMILLYIINKLIAVSNYQFFLQNHHFSCWLVLSLLGFSGGSDGKESASNAGDLGSIPGSGRSLKKGMATHSSILAWRIPWIEEPGGLQSMWSQRDMTEWLTHTLQLEAKKIKLLPFGKDILEGKN